MVYLVVILNLIVLLIFYFYFRKKIVKCPLCPECAKCPPLYANFSGEYVKNDIKMIVKTTNCTVLAYNDKDGVVAKRISETEAIFGLGTITFTNNKMIIKTSRSEEIFVKI